jgi:hypothetical protein
VVDCQTKDQGKVSRYFLADNAFDPVIAVKKITALASWTIAIIQAKHQQNNDDVAS